MCSREHSSTGSPAHPVTEQPRDPVYGELFLSRMGSPIMVGSD